MAKQEMDRVVEMTDADQQPASVQVIVSPSPEEGTMIEIRADGVYTMLCPTPEELHRLKVAIDDAFRITFNNLDD